MNISSPPSFDRMSIAGSRAEAWLLKLSDLVGSDIRTHMSAILQTLIGCWICEVALAAEARKSGLQSIARRIQKSLDGEEQEVVSALLRSDAALVLLSAGILRTLKCKSETLELFVQQVSSNVQEYDMSQTKSIELSPACFLLHRLGLRPAPVTSTFNWLQNYYSVDLLQADESVIRSLAATVATSTEYGERSLSVEQEFLERLALELPILMIYYLRQYNFEIGSLLLRTMNYLHVESDIAFHMGLNFILAQQQTDGRFGFLAQEIFRARLIRPDLKKEIDVYLPFTLSCLWAITEIMVPGFVLFRSI